MTASASKGSEEGWRPSALFAGQACEFHNHGSSDEIRVSPRFGCQVFVRVCHGHVQTLAKEKRQACSQGNHDDLEPLRPPWHITGKRGICLKRVTFNGGGRGAASSGCRRFKRHIQCTHSAYISLRLI
jgi:hypothetical protein